MARPLVRVLPWLRVLRWCDGCETYTESDIDCGEEFCIVCGLGNDEADEDDCCDGTCCADD